MGSIIVSQLYANMSFPLIYDLAKITPKWGSSVDNNGLLESAKEITLALIISSGKKQSYIFRLSLSLFLTLFFLTIASIIPFTFTPSTCKI